jgi:hypothetical protein
LIGGVGSSRPDVPTFGLLLAGLALTACGGTGPADESSGEVLTASDLHLVGTSDSIAVVEDLAVLDEGSVWIQNSVEPLFLAFDGSGGTTAAHGRLGGGPGEFDAPAGFVAGGLDGEAWLLDRARNVLVRVSSPDLPRADVRLPTEGFPPGSILGGMSLMAATVRTARLGREVVLPRRRGVDEVSPVGYWTTIWNADLVAFDPSTGRVRTVVPLPEVLGDMGAYFAEVGGDFPPFPFWYRLWTVCDEEVWLHDLVRNQLRGFAGDGTEGEAVPLPPPPFTEVGPLDFVRTLFDLIAAERTGGVNAGVGFMSPADSARLIQGAVAGLEGSSAQHGAVLPKYVDLRCGDDGTLWLQPLDLQAGGMRGSPSWLALTREGSVRRVQFPARFQPFRFEDGKAWGVARDELDVASVAWVALP